MAIASDEEIAKILRLPDGPDGINQLHKMIADLGSELNEREKIFILLYTNPMSKFCGKLNQCSYKVAGYKSFGSWAMQNQKIKKLISDLQDKTLLDEIKTALTEDARRCMRVLNTDRSSYRTDTEYTFTSKDGNEITVERIKDKKISELTKDQREAIADYTPDKDGNLHPIIEKRSEARAALQNYQKLYGKIDDESKNVETVITLDAIKEKVTAKISVIQKNNEDAIKAGSFIDSMADLDEEA